MTRSMLVGSLVVLAACGHQAASARAATLNIAGRSVTLPASTAADGSSRAAELASAPHLMHQAAMPVAPAAR